MLGGVLGNTISRDIDLIVGTETESIMQSGVDFTSENELRSFVENLSS